MLGFDPASRMLGSFLKYDGTIEFYGRIRAIVDRNSIVIDLGAGRGGWYVDDPSSYRKAIRDLRNDVARLIGCDIDPIILENRSTHENRLIENGRLPFHDSSADLIVADFVLEHVTDVPSFYKEVERVLRPGGFFCARTPHAWNYIAICARLVKNTFHANVLKFAQPNRKATDVFPTAYRLNTISAVKKHWSPQHWDDYSYIYTSEPQYFFGSKVTYHLLDRLQKLLPEAVTGNCFFFLKKRHSRLQAPDRSIRAGAE